jgi:hypothetical protein
MISNTPDFAGASPCLCTQTQEISKKFYWENIHAFADMAPAMHGVIIVEHIFKKLLLDVAMF